LHHKKGNNSYGLEVKEHTEVEKATGSEVKVRMEFRIGRLRGQNWK